MKYSHSIKFEKETKKQKKVLVGEKDEPTDWYGVLGVSPERPMSRRLRLRRNKANIYKSRARLTDLEWLRMIDNGLEWLRMT